MKVLDFQAVKAIAAGTPDSELIRWVDEALREKPGYTLPPKIHISQQDGDYYNVMPCICERGNLAMVKMIGRHGIKRGEERSVMMGDILLYESDTGILKALMDGEYITTLRTGISAAHSARLFTRPDFETVGLIGLGNIMTVCIRAFVSSLRAEGDRRPITLKLIRYHGHENRIMNLFRQDPDVHFVLCDTYEQVIGGSDLVISAITKVTENFVTDEYFKEGCTVIPICTRASRTATCSLTGCSPTKLSRSGASGISTTSPPSPPTSPTCSTAPPLAARTMSSASWCITTASPSTTWSLPPTSWPGPKPPTHRITTAGKNTLSDAFCAIYCPKSRKAFGAVSLSKRLF